MTEEPTAPATGSPGSPLDLDQFIVKEHVGMFKLTDVFDILDPNTQQKIALAREVPGGFIKFLRLVINKKALPTEVVVTQGDENGPVLFRIKKPFTLFRSRVSVLDASGVEVGYFKNKLFSFGGGFWVYDTSDNQVAEVKGDWKGRDFTFIGAEGKEIGKVTMKWGGVAKELFTSADTYMVSLTGSSGENQVIKILLLSAALAIDIVFKEAG